ncbi:MAG: tRNA (adenosine(37)-N6)-threonylcarbamoyltransferase complex dimerization subunit type 1 TsaB [Pirellulales bacterium]
MRILAIETVEKAGSVALVEGERVIVERRLDNQCGSAQSLAPTIEQLFREAHWRAGDVELVAVATGPGSFTGLRIGVTTAKVFAYASACQVIGVSTMTAIATRVPENVTHFSVILDAHRNELFVADFSRQEGGRLVGEETTRIESAEQWIAELRPATVVSGPGLAKWSPRLGAETIVVDSALWAATAAAVGRLGWRAFAAGKRTSPFELVPQYFRRAAAEEKAEDRRQKAEEGTV